MSAATGFGCALEAVSGFPAAGLLAVTAVGAGAPALAALTPDLALAPHAASNNSAAQVVTKVSTFNVTPFLV
jgi:hypothetical protein